MNNNKELLGLLSSGLCTKISFMHTQYSYLYCSYYRHLLDCDVAVTGVHAHMRKMVLWEGEIINHPCIDNCRR